MGETAGLDGRADDARPRRLRRRLPALDPGRAHRADRPAAVDDAPHPRPARGAALARAQRPELRPRHAGPRARGPRGRPPRAAGDRHPAARPSCTSAPARWRAWPCSTGGTSCTSTGRAAGLSSDVITRVGGRAPAHATAAGKAMLAWHDDAVLRCVVLRTGCRPAPPAPSRPSTPCARTSPRCGQRGGIAYDREEVGAGNGRGRRRAPGRGPPGRGPAALRRRSR